MKKLIALLLVLVLAAGCFAGCSSKDDTKAVNFGGDVDLNSTTGGDTPETSALGRYEDTVTFTTARELDLGASFPDGMSVTENPYIDAVKDKLNVEMNLLWQTADYSTKLDMCIVSDDLPDIFWVDNYMTYLELLDNDMLEPLTDAYRNCAGDYMRDVYASYGDDIFSAYISDGELYALPSTNNGYQYSVLWIRQDWLDKLGLEAPTTRDELVEVAKQFMEKDPGGNGAGNTIGIAVQSNPLGSSSNSFGLDPIMASFGSYPGQWVTGDDGKVVYGSITDETKEGLSYLADLYKQGVIDPQFMVRDYSDVVGLISTGRCGICFFPWSMPYSTSDFIANNPDGEWTVLEAPVNDEGKFTYVSNRLDNGILCVRKGYEHPEVLIKILNVEFDMYRGIDKDGYEALTPLFDAGTTWTAPMITGHFNLEYDDAVPAIGKLVADYIEKGITPTDTTEYNIQLVQKAKDYFDNPTVTDTDGWICYTSRYIASNALKNGVKIPSAFDYATSTMATKWPTLEKQEDEYFLQVITGQASIDDFDSFVNQWLTLGGEDITAEVQQYKDAASK